jgi:ABC-type sugar transport system ATPase subunit
LRPEYIILCEGSDDQEKPDCILQVSAYENMGNEQLVYLSFAKQTLIARRPPLETIEVGKEKGIRFMLKKSILLNDLGGDVISTNL